MPNYLFLATDGGNFLCETSGFIRIVIVLSFPVRKKDNSSVSNHNSETAYCNTIHCVYETYKSLKYSYLQLLKRYSLYSLGIQFFCIKIILIYLHRIW